MAALPKQITSELVSVGVLGRTPEVCSQLNACLRRLPIQLVFNERASAFDSAHVSRLQSLRPELLLVEQPADRAEIPSLIKRLTRRASRFVDHPGQPPRRLRGNSGGHSRGRARLSVSAFRPGSVGCGYAAGGDTVQDFGRVRAHRAEWSVSCRSRVAAGLRPSRPTQRSAWLARAAKRRVLPIST